MLLVVPESIFRNALWLKWVEETTKVSGLGSSMWSCSDGQQCPGSISAVSLHSYWGFFGCVPGKALCPADSLVHWVCQCPLIHASGRLQFWWSWLGLVLRQEHVILWAPRLCIHCVLQVCAFVICCLCAFQSVCAACVCVWGVSTFASSPVLCDQTVPQGSLCHAGMGGDPRAAAAKPWDSARLEIVLSSPCCSSI